MRILLMDFSNYSHLQQLITKRGAYMAATTEKGKTIQNYVLQTLKSLTPDGSQIWIARHKILKKAYTLKRTSYAKNSNQKINTFENDDELNAFKAKKIIRQVELLKQLKMEGTPKCQKMIKTSNSLYVVYEEFPGILLSQFIKGFGLQLNQKIKIMINLAKELQKYHAQSIVFLLLAPENIFRGSDGNMFFSQWSSAVYKGNSSSVLPIINIKRSEYIAKEVIEESRCSPASDIFSLGKIFSSIADKNMVSVQNDPIYAELSILIGIMTDENDLKRPSLQQITKKLQNIRIGSTKIELSKSVSQFKFNKIEKRNTAATLKTQQNEVSQEKFLNKNASVSTLYGKLNENSKDVKESRLTNTVSFDNILIGMSRSVSRPSLSRIRKSSEQIIKKMTKCRNLCFFILQLSGFAMKWEHGEQLGYLLLKQAYLILNNCYNEWNNQELQDKSTITVTEILKEEIVQLNVRLNMLKEYLLPKRRLIQFRNELRNDVLINEKYIREKIVTFCSRQMEEINQSIKQSKIKNQDDLVNDLFSIYMILKRLESGSFERYWDKIYSYEYAFLKNQSYFAEEKKLGHRYLRSKIFEILSKK